MNAPRHARRLAIHLPEHMTDHDPITDNDLAADGEPHCESHHPDCTHITCQRRPHTDTTGRPIGLCVRVRRSPYSAAYWSAEAGTRPTARKVTPTPPRTPTAKAPTAAGGDAAPASSPRPDGSRHELRRRLLGDPPMTDHDIRVQLAEALRWAPDDLGRTVETLLPVVRGLIADHLDAAAEAMSWPNSQNCGPELRDRAAALRTQP